MIIKYKKYIIIITTIFIILKPAYSSENNQLNCKGIYWLNQKALYIEWTIKKGIPKFTISFKINNDIELAKFSIRKGNAGTIIGIGGWDKKTGEKNSLSIRYSILTKIFKMESRYTNLRIEGKCKGILKL